MSFPENRTLDGSLPQIQSHRGLTPLESCSIPTVSNLSQPARKRKRNEISNDIGIGNPFTIQAHPSSTSGTQLRLLPIALLDRSCLPLAYIDTSGGSEDLGSRLFSARIAALEPHLPEVQRSYQTAVLIANSESYGSMYAVESVQVGVYALCRLGEWVTFEDIRGLQAKSLENMPRQNRIVHEPVKASIDEWWRPAAVPDDRTDRSREARKQKSAKLENFGLCLKPPAFIPPRITPVIEKLLPKHSQSQAPSRLDDMVEEPIPQDTPQEPEGVLDMVRAQYQEALYVSKTSLAYFAKGPLSRARAVFRGSAGSSTNSLRLVQSLRFNVLSLAVMDKKYREALPNIVKELPTSVLTEDEIPSIVSSQGRKDRKSKKGKVRKDGLYPGEEASITRWWLSREKPSMISDSSNGKEDSIRAILLEQRARETQLQIILVLEILALEASILEPLANQETPPTIALEQESNLNKKSKAKKSQDLNTLLDLLVDRLCIWQSMNVDEAKGAPPAEASASQPGGKASDKVHLRDFCVDVVLPFYGARLPDVSKMLCQKLGGPKSLSPARPSLAKAASASQSLIKPGSTLQRQQPRKPRRTLERVLTDERSRSRKPSLLRSATDTMVPNLKREVSDMSLSAVPLNRLNLQKSKRYSQREVDFIAVSHTVEARLKKKASIEQELQGAIAALKKPNPRVAVKELIEAAEKRAAESRTRKPKNPIRNLFAQGVQVTATPSRNRQRDVFGRLLPQPAIPLQADPEEIPPSSGLRAPDSLIKAVGLSVSMSDEWPKSMQRNTLPSVEQTPTRESSKLTNPLRNSTNVLASIEQTPTRDPSKPLKSLEGPVAKRTHGLFNPLAPLPRPHQGLTSPRQLLGKSKAPGLPPSWPLEVHATPSKASPSKQSYFQLREGPQETPVKPSKAKEFSEITTQDPLETPIKPLGATNVSHEGPVPATSTAASTPTELGLSIYQSLGWDDVDELS